MASISFGESLKYGIGLFGFFFAITVVGLGLLGLGGALAVPEIRTWIASGNPQTAVLAGGLVLAVFGFATLVILHFAMAYKLVADAVAAGSGGVVAASRTEELTGEEEPAGDSTQRTELGPSPGEQAASETGPGQTVPGGRDSESDTRSIPSKDPETTDQPAPRDAAEQHSPSDGPVSSQASPAADEPAHRSGGEMEYSAASEEDPAAHSPDSGEQGGGRPSDSGEQDPAEGPQDTTSADTRERPEPRERTAEEIAFGTTARTSEEGEPTADRSERSADPAQDNESSDPDTTSVDDGAWFDDEADETEGDSSAGENSRDRSETETAGNSSTDPLSEPLDDE